MGVAAVKNGRPAAPRALEVLFWEGIRSGLGVQEALAAQGKAQHRAARPKTAKLVGNAELRGLVQARLTQKWPPEQISAWLRRQFPGRPEMQVSRERICQSICVQGRGALRRELAACLRTGRALRKPRRRDGERRGRIPGMVMISERPAEVADRALPVCPD